jgi:hypothetical protein
MAEGINHHIYINNSLSGLINGGNNQSINQEFQNGIQLY